MYALTNTVKDYAWGSTDAIAQLLGTQPSGSPQAELWIGAHPSDPSSVDTAEGRRSLLDVIASDPAATLGVDVARRFGGALPFLLKILSAAAPLSLQVHPSKGQARAGYAAENAAGVPLDSPTRNYKDTNHKPELLFALGPFEALSGFNRPAASVSLLRQLRTRTRSGGVLDDLVEDLSGTDESVALRRATERLLTLDASVAAESVADVVAACAGIDSASARTAIELNSYYPGDAGVVLSLLLNRVSLAPGEAIFLPTGNIHAYLRGTGVEIMATSDNVLRGGLTRKHIDVPELLSVVDFTARVPPRQWPRQISAGQLDFTPPVEDFCLSVLDVEGGSDIHYDDRLPRTAIVLDGEVTIGGCGDALTLRRGQSVFIGAVDAPVVIAGTGRLAVGAPGS